jgi:hypothetical protein
MSELNIFNILFHIVNIMAAPTNATYADLIVAPQSNSAIYVGATTNNQASSINIRPTSLQVFDVSANPVRYSTTGIVSSSLSTFNISAANLTFGNTGNASNASGYVLTCNGPGLCPTFKQVPFPVDTMTLDQALANGNTTATSIFVQDNSGNYTNINIANVSLKDANSRSMLSTTRLNMSSSDGTYWNTISLNNLDVSKNTILKLSSSATGYDVSANIIKLDANNGLFIDNSGSMVITPRKIQTTGALDISASSLTIGGSTGTLGQVLVSTGGGLPVWFSIPTVQRYYTPTGTTGAVTYSGFAAVPVVVGTAVSTDGSVISISVSSVTNTGCNWTTSSLALRVNFIIYSNDN